MSNTIYTSERVLPYVYMGTHKTTGQFYIGNRFGEKVYIQKGRPSHIDFGTYYKTSSKHVQQLGFNNFNWIILAEFFTGDDARAFEDELIRLNWRDPLNINHYRGGAGQNFHTQGLNRSTETRRKMGLVHKGKHLSESHRNKIGEAHRGMKRSKETCENISKSNKGRIITPEIRQKISKSLLGKSYLSEEGRNNIIRANTGSKRTDEQKLNISKGIKNIPSLICPYCDKSGNHGAMMRWHFDKCKFKV